MGKKIGQNQTCSSCNLAVVAGKNVNIYLVFVIFKIHFKYMGLNGTFGIIIKL